VIAGGVELIAARMLVLGYLAFLSLEKSSTYSSSMSEGKGWGKKRRTKDIAGQKSTHAGIYSRRKVKYHRTKAAIHRVYRSRL